MLLELWQITTHIERKKGEKYMKRITLFTIFILSLMLAACGEKQIETTLEEQVDYFEATTESDETLTRDDLLGTYWVANFVFTNCTTTCPPMTANMKALQDQLKEAGIEDVHLISFSVDPDRDTPKALREFADEFGADLNNWSFLTGYEFNEIRELSINSFKSLVEPPPEGSDQVSHGTAFFLVDPDGNVIKHYSGTQRDQMEVIVEDLKLVN